MAIEPGTYDMKIQRRSDHSENFEAVVKATNAAINLTGYTLTSQVWDSGRTTKAADATMTITNAAGGLFTWKVTDTQTTTFTANEYKYDILFTNGSGDKEYWIEGTIYMDEGYTA
tara:strand:+ start:13521 stop:13865 length:345 start_codon:yes stop_codon:yes gene_type:complete